MAQNGTRYVRYNIDNYWFPPKYSALCCFYFLWLDEKYAEIHNARKNWTEIWKGQKRTAYLDVFKSVYAIIPNLPALTEEENERPLSG